jgi:hypothetical protein
VDYGAAWAQAGSVPFRMFKGYVAEGGIRSPLIIAGPGVKQAGSINAAFLHVMDIAPKNNGVILSGDGPFKRGKEASVAEDLGD